MTNRFFHTSHDGLFTAILAEHTVAIVELAQWADLDSSAVETHGTYNAVLGYVYIPDLKCLPCEESQHAAMLRALKSCGMAFDADRNVINDHDLSMVCERGRARSKARRNWILCVSEAMWRYGARDRVDDISGNNREDILTKAKRAL